MPSFAYKGRDSGGKLVEGVVDGADSGAVVDLLRGQGLTPVAITPAPSGATKKSFDWNLRLTRPRVGHIDLLLFSRQMYTLL